MTASSDHEESPVGEPAQTVGDTDVAIVHQDGILMATGSDAAVHTFLVSLGAGETPSSNQISAAVMRTVGAAAGIASNTHMTSGRWVQLTQDSAERLKQLAGTNMPKNGVYGGVIRADKGRIAQHVTFRMPARGSVNPLVLANVATLATSMAAAAAEAEMRELLEGIDKKLDALAEDRRSEVIGAARGVTEAIGEAFAHYQHASELGETAWDKIQSVLPQVLGTWHRGIDQLRMRMDEVAGSRPTERDDTLKRLNDDVLALWLPVLGQCLVTLTRYRVLEQARVDKVEPHLSESHRQLSDQRHQELLEQLRDTVQSLLTGAASALDVPHRVRIAHPLQVAKMHDAAGSIKVQMLDFANRVDWYLDHSGEWENKGWKHAVREVSSTGRSALAEVATTSADTVKRAAIGASSAVRETTADSTLTVQRKIHAGMQRFRSRQDRVGGDATDENS